MRQERNGKIVYVPSSNVLNPSNTSTPRIQARAARQRVYYFASLLGACCERWLPPIVIASAAGLNLGLVWLGWHTLTNPDMIYWVNQWTPGNRNRKIPADDQPKTLDEIVAQMRRNGKNPGEPIALDSEFGFGDYTNRAKTAAFPIWVNRKDSGCPKGCEAIQAIQVYRTIELPRLIRLFQRQPRFRKANRLAIAGPSEQDLARLVRSLTRSGSAEGSTSPMPMSAVAMMDTGGANRWLLLSGLKSKGNATASFGQILHVSPQRTQMSVMLNWLSPSGKSPVWKDVTGDGQLDIMIEQSFELEPSFSVYQLEQSPNGSRWVRPITLSTAAIATPAYQNALRLAKSGLWNQAQARLEILKTESQVWPLEAQTQLEFIRLHVEVLRLDANLAFSDPVAEVQALLIRGEWQHAQAALLKSPNVFESVQIVLESDNGQIGDRIHTAALVGPDKQAAVDWGIVYHYARGGKGQAESWLKTNHSQFASRLKPMLKKMTDVTRTESEGSSSNQT